MKAARQRFDGLAAHAPVLLIFSLVGASMLWSPALPQDFWWQMAMGRLALDHGAVPRTEPFSYTYAGTPIYNQSWLVQVFLYALYSLGDLRLVITAQAASITLAFVLLAMLCARRGASWGLSALLCGGSIMLFVSPFLTLRPQSFALPLFPALLLVLDRWRAQIDTAWQGNSIPSGKSVKLWLLPLLMLFWVNMHGSFVLGLLLIGLYGANEAWRWFWATIQPFIAARLQANAERRAQNAAQDSGQQAAVSGDDNQSQVIRLSGHQVSRSPRPHLRLYLPFLLWGIASVAAVFINPYGLEIVAYVRQFGVLTPVQLTLVEWQPVLLSNEVGTYIYLVLALGLALYAPKRADWRDMLIVALFLWLGLSRVRGLLWFHLALLPIVAAQLAQLLPQQAPKTSITNRLLALLAAMILVFSLPWTHDLVGFSSQPDTFANSMTPINAVDALRKLPNRPKRLYHNLSTGSYLPWALPEQPVFVYPLVEIYAEPFWKDYVDLRSGQRVDELIAKYNFDGMLLHNVENAALLEQLHHAPGWRERYHDESYTLLTK